LLLQARFLAYNSPKNVWRLGFAQTRPPSHKTRGLLLRGGEGRKGKGIGWQGRGREGRGKKGRRKKREGKGEGRGGGKGEGRAPLTQIPGSAPAIKTGYNIPNW